MQKLDRTLLKKTLDASLTADLENRYLGGAQIAVRQGGELLYENTVGYQNACTGEPLKKNAMYRLASMTKPVTGVATLIAVERGWFDLEDKLEDYLPQFADMMVCRIEKGVPVPDHKARRPLKIWHMLAHCSGMMAENEIGRAVFEQMPAAAFANIAAAVDYCATAPLAFDPEEETAYSGYTAFDCVARIIEMKSGISYPEFVKQNIFDPLGITDLTFRPTEEQWSRMIVMNDRAEGIGFINVDMGRHVYESFPLDYPTAGAGLAGTLRDYGIFAEMLRGRGSYGGVKIFSPELLEEMRKPRIPLTTPGRDPISSWGLGVRVVDQPSLLPVGTFGWSGAYGTHFWVDTENEITVVFLRNGRFYDGHGCGEMGQRYERDVMACLETKKMIGNCI